MKYILILTFFLTSCASLEKFGFSKKKAQDISLLEYREYTDEDFINQLKSLEGVFLEQNKRVVSKITGKNKAFLGDLVRALRSNNELFFESKEEPTFYIVNSKTPFHFSLPGFKFFFSSGLIKKYVKSEIILYCMLAYELVRSEKKLYRKRILIPTKVMSVERILSMLRLPTNDKIEIHKWVYYIIKRTNGDADSYLSWLQIKNRNSIDFTLQLGDIRSISREEALFKTFSIETQKQTKSKAFRGSSSSFYYFLRSIKG